MMLDHEGGIGEVDSHKNQVRTFVTFFKYIRKLFKFLVCITIEIFVKIHKHFVGIRL